MTRIMGDSTVIDDIPTSVDIAAFYLNGNFAAETAVVEARFPHAHYGWCGIDINGELADRADMLDVESGDATPDTANLWVQSWHKLRRPGLAPVYCNRRNMHDVIDACQRGGSELGVQFGLVVATLDGAIVSGPGILGCQDKGTHLTGSHWDSSLVYASNIWLPVQPPAPPRRPAPVSQRDAENALGILERFVQTA